jgi:hypothetical protein
MLPWQIDQPLHLIYTLSDGLNPVAVEVFGVNEQ